jgi:hypothetical protein
VKCLKALDFWLDLSFVCAAPDRMIWSFFVLQLFVGRAKMPVRVGNTAVRVKE